MTEGQQRTLGAVAALAGIGWFFEKYWREVLILWASVTAVLWMLVYLRYRSLPLRRVWQRGRRIAEYAWVFVFWEVIALFVFLVAVFVEHRGQLHHFSEIWTVPYAEWHNPQDILVMILGFVTYALPIIAALAVLYLGPLYLTYLGWVLATEELDTRQEHDRLIRGRRILTMREVCQSLPAESPRGFGFLPIEPEELKNHNLIVGATGSGKTIAVKSFLGKILSDIGKGSRERAIIYDAKTEFFPLAELYVPPKKLYNLNPFDMRSAAWDMAKDIIAPAQAQTVAEILVPKNPHASQPFFEDATRTLLTGVMIAFMKNAATEWTFRDVLLALATKKKLKEVLLSCDQTKDLWEKFFSDERVGDNVLSSVAANLSPFEFIAAAWERAERHISLKEFVEGEAVIVLGNDEEQRSALDRVNRLIFRRLSEQLLSLPDNQRSTTHVVLDETREAGKLDGLHSLLVRGRSKGVAVLLTFQEIEGLRQVYGDKVAHEITGQCGNKIFLRLGSPQTAEWASSFFGEQEWIEVRRSTSEGQSSGSTSGGFAGHSSTQRGTNAGSSWSESRVVKKAVPPSTLLDMPKAGPQNGFFGYADFHSVGAFQIAFSWEYVAELLPPHGRVPALEKRPAEHQYLTPWDEADRKRLRLSTDSGDRKAEVEEKDAAMDSYHSFDHIKRRKRVLEN